MTPPLKASTAPVAGHETTVTDVRPVSYEELWAAIREAHEVLARTTELIDRTS